MQAKITKRLVDSLKPQPKLYAVRDTELKGFTLRVRPNGGMTWLFDYRNAEGRRLNYKIGAYPGLMPEGARRIAETIAGKIAGSVDPQAEKKEAKAEAARAKVSTLGAFIKDRYEPWAIQHLRRGDVAVARLKADFAKWLDEPLESFNKWRMESWTRDRLKSGVKPVSVRRQLDTLRSCLRKSVDWNVLDKHPMQGLERLKVEDDDRVRYLSPAEEKRLRDALVKRENDIRAARARFNKWLKARRRATLPEHSEVYVDHLRPLVLVALNTGLRRGELFSLRWSDVTADMLTVRAAAAKTATTRHLPLSVEAKQVFTDWRKQSEHSAGEDLVFPGANSKRLTNVNKAWETVCELAKLVNFRFHDCRHHFASSLVQRGVDLNVVRELMGHKNITMTLRYAHLNDDNLKAAVAMLG